MQIYEFFYKDTLLGLLTVNEKEEYAFQPEPLGVEAVKDRVPLPREVEQGTGGFGPSIPFFRERLQLMQRWNLQQINYQTDWFLLRRKTE